MVQKTPCWMENDVGDKKNKKLHQFKVLVRRLLVSFAAAAPAGVTLGVGAGSLRDSGQPYYQGSLLPVKETSRLPSSRVFFVPCDRILQKTHYFKRPQSIHLYMHTICSIPVPSPIFSCKDELAANYRVHQLMGEVKALDLLKFSFNNSF